MSETQLRLRSLWIAIGWALVTAVVWLGLTPKLPEVGVLEFNQSDKMGHLLAYAVLMGWFTQLYHHTATRLRYAVGFTLLGVVVELLQGLGGARHFDIADMIANLLGVMVGWGLALTPLDRFLFRVERIAFG